MSRCKDGSSTFARASSRPSLRNGEQLLPVGNDDGKSACLQAVNRSASWDPGALDHLLLKDGFTSASHDKALVDEDGDE